MAKLADNTFSTIKEIKAFEVVSSKCSESYVPIYSSDIVKVLAPEFEMISGSRLRGGTSAHFIDFEHEGETIRIYNSFDRKVAFRANLISEGFVIDLGIDRLIHRGQRAKTMITDLTELKPEILKAVKTAKTIRAKFDKEVVDVHIAKEISDLIFAKFIKKEGFQEYVNYADILIPKQVSIKTYITTSINKYLQGDYTITNNGVKRNGKPANATLAKVKIQNRLVKYLSDNFPEYFL